MSQKSFVHFSGISLQTLNGLFLRLDTTNNPLTGVLRGVNGSASAPAFANANNTGSGMYWDIEGNTIFSTKGLSMMKIQSTPPRIFVGENAGAGIPLNTLHMEGESASGRFNRTINAESALTLVVQGTGGGTLRGMVAGGVRITDASASIEIARLTLGTNGGLQVGTIVQDATFRIQQKAGATVVPMIVQSVAGFRTVMYQSGRVGIFQPTTATEGLASFIVSGGNNGTGNATATLRMGRNSSGDTRQNHYFSTNHSASNNDVNIVRLWTYDIGGSGTATDFPNDCKITWSAGNGKMVINSQTLSTNVNFAVNGSRGLKVTVLDATTLTLDNTHEVIAVDHTDTAAVTITLPSASSSFDTTNSVGRTYLIKDTGANASVNNITINRAGSDTIITDNTSDTSIVITGDGDAVRLTAISTTQWILH